MFENLEDFMSASNESFVSTTAQSGNNNDTIEYHPRPKDSKSEDGVYRSTIRIVQDLREEGDSAKFNRKRTYFFKSPAGLLPWDIYEKNDPATEMFFTLRNSQNPNVSNAVKDTKNDERMFRQNIGTYVLIQVIKDDNKPDLTGKYMVWKLPKAIQDIIENRNTKGIQPGLMNPLLGFSLMLEVTPGPKDPSNPQRETREIKYTASEFDTDSIQPVCKVDGTSFLTDEEYDKLNNFAIDFQKITKKGINDEKTKEKLKKQFDDCKELMKTKTDEIKEYFISLGDSMASAAKFVVPREHTKEDLMKFVDIVSNYILFIGGTQNDVWAALKKCNLMEYSIEAQYTQGATGGQAQPQAQPTQAPVDVPTTNPTTGGSEDVTLPF